MKICVKGNANGMNVYQMMDVVCVYVENNKVISLYKSVGWSKLIGSSDLLCFCPDPPGFNYLVQYVFEVFAENYLRNGGRLSFSIFYKIFYIVRFKALHSFTFVNITRYR